MSVVALAAALLAASAHGEPGVLSPEKAEMMGRVEDFLLHNFRDVTWRKSLEWGDVQAQDDGTRAIEYDYEAKIWDKDILVMRQAFAFDANGRFLRYDNVQGYPKKKASKAADVSTRKGMIELVEAFFADNFRDVTARKTIEWGPVGKDDQGNSTIRYKYLATIWGQDQKELDQVFTFDPTGQFVSVQDTSEGAPPAVDSALSGKGVAATSSAARLTDAEREKVEKAVLDAHENMLRAINRLDADEFFTWILDGENAIIRDGAILSRQEALDAVRAGFEGVLTSEYKPNRTIVTVISPDAAVLTAEGTSNVMLPDGRSFSTPCAWTLVFVRDDNQWKVRHGHQSMPNEP
jgi:hypothetical protein